MEYRTLGSTGWSISAISFGAWAIGGSWGAVDDSESLQALETGVQAVRELEAVKPEGLTMAQFALRWILMHDAATCVIPGAKRPDQAAENARAADAPPLTDDTMDAVRDIYDTFIREQVHHRW